MAPNFLFLFCFFLSIIQSSISQNTLNFTSFNISNSPWQPNQNLTLLSPNSKFSAGFFPISSNLYTFSIWFTNVPLTANPVVWTANSGSPVTANGSLIITSKGELFLNSTLLANTSSNSTSPSLTLNNQGKLSFGDWNSFDHPTDTILPNQNISRIELTSQNGNFKFVNSTNLISISNSNTNISLATYYTTPSPLVSMDELGQVTMQNGAFLTSDYGDNVIRKMVLGNDGNLKIFSLNTSQKIPTWQEVWLGIWEPCKIKGKCGPNAICLPLTGINDSTSCTCPPGFNKNQGFPQQGCSRKTTLSNNIKFLRLDYVNYTSNNIKNIYGQNFTLCESTCRSNPKCLAFGYKYDGSGTCSLVLDQLLYGYWSPGTESSLFLKVDKSETETSNFTGMTEILQNSCPVKISLPLPPKDSNSTTRNIAIICTLFAAELISGIAFFWSFLKRYIKYRDMATTLGLEFLPAGGPKRFSHSELKIATKNFSTLIGRGGFGDVYKGELSDHRIVAVKCLKNVAGGDAEFWAEVTIIARMHHLNLVRLWGFCAEKGQRILVYEYIPGGSLDKYLFRRDRAGPKTSDLGSDVKNDPNWAGPKESGLGLDVKNGPNWAGPKESSSLGLDVKNDVTRKPILDWNVRYRIALGVARAIAYLHEECLEWVLHCDIKPENILLGDDFCPKISDFGLAKLRKKEDMVTMSRRRGTPGYMAPEWITTDPITSKADVYSFGMVLLELVSGVRNFEIQGSQLNSEEWYFPGWAFDKMFKEMRPEDILDREIKQLYDSRAHFNMINRMVKTAMWCLQDRPEMRPTMGKVAKMLEGTVEIIEPKKPTVFFLGDE